MDLDVFFYVTAGMGVALLFGIAGRLGTIMKLLDDINYNILKMLERSQDHWSEMEKLVPEEKPDIPYYDYGGEEESEGAEEGAGVCGKCGANIVDGVSHCGQCGNALGAFQPMTNSEKAILVIVAIFVLAAVLANLFP